MEYALQIASEAAAEDAEAASERWSPALGGAGYVLGGRPSRVGGGKVWGVMCPAPPNLKMKAVFQKGLRTNLS